MPFHFNIQATTSKHRNLLFPLQYKLIIDKTA